MSSLSALVVIATLLVVSNSAGASSAGIEVSRLFATKDVRQPVATKRGSDIGGGCGCEENDCGCCAHINVEKIQLDDNVCTNLTYLPDSNSVSFTITINGNVVYNTTISLNIPPSPVCVEIPFLEKNASVCVGFDNVDVKQSKFSGCVHVEVKSEGLILDKFDTGCFKITPGGAKEAVVQGDNRGQDVRQALVAMKHDDRGTGCGCKGDNCGCCAHMEVDRIGLNDTVCTNLTYLPDQYGVSLTLSIDGKVYFNETVSAKNPPPVCAGIPYLEKYASLCVKLYNLSISKTQFSGCALIKAKLEGLVIDEYKLGCFKIPLGRSKVALKQGDNKVQDVRQALIALRHGDRGTGCGCKGYNCGCCAHMEVDKIGLNNTVCTNLTYLPNEYGVSLTLSVDGKVYYNNTVSLKNPPPMCIGVPYLKKYASLCVKLYNLTYSKSKFSGCVLIKAKLEGLVIDEYKLGCFKIPPGGSKVALKQGDNRGQVSTKASHLSAKAKAMGCSCLYYDCGCCMDLLLGLEASNKKVCANMTFLTETSEVTLTLSVDKVIYFKKTIPVRNPAPICFHLPELTSLDMCVQLYSLDIKDAKLTGCIRLLSEDDGKVVDSFDLGCFSFPAVLIQKKSLLTKQDGRSSRLENLLFVAYKEAKKDKMFNSL